MILNLNFTRLIFLLFLLFNIGTAQAGARFIIKTDGTELTQLLLDEMNQQSGLQMLFIRHSYQHYYIVENSETGSIQLEGIQLNGLLNAYRQNSVIIEMLPEKIFKPHLTPTDTLFTDQWYFKQADFIGNNNGVNATKLWDVSRGNPAIVIAIIDTGILLNHPEFENSRFLPGADLINSTFKSNDGDGRDMDPVDPGDAYGGKASTWHGTAVTSLIAANINQYEITGLSPEVSILPIRALGAGGGSGTDIVEAMLWAAGESVSGVDDNPYPAKIINLSLGGFDANGVCDTYWQDAIDYLANEKDIIFVVAAGNEEQDATLSIPANCANTITVAATNSSGNKAWFSNFGDAVTIAAPGESILVAGDLGTDQAESNTVYYYDGTSFATPIVSAAIATYLEYNPNIKASDLRQLVVDTAMPFNETSDCKNNVCGAGIIDPVAMIMTADANAFEDNNVTIVNLPPVISVTQTTIYINSEQTLSLAEFISISDPEEGPLSFNALTINDNLSDDGSGNNSGNKPDNNSNDNAGNKIDSHTITITENDINITATLLIDSPENTVTVNLSLSATDNIGEISAPVLMTIIIQPQANNLPVVTQISEIAYVLENNFIDISLLATAIDPDTYIDSVNIIHHTALELNGINKPFLQAPEIDSNEASIFFEIEFCDNNFGCQSSAIIQIIVLKLDPIINPPVVPPASSPNTPPTTDHSDATETIPPDDIEPTPIEQPEPVQPEPIEPEPILPEPEQPDPVLPSPEQPDQAEPAPNPDSDANNPIIDENQNGNTTSENNPPNPIKEDNSEQSTSIPDIPQPVIPPSTTPGTTEKGEDLDDAAELSQYENWSDDTGTHPDSSSIVDKNTINDSDSISSKDNDSIWGGTISYFFILLMQGPILLRIFHNNKLEL